MNGLQGAVLQQVKTHGFTTAPLAAKVFFNRRTPKASALLSRLVREGHLFRHVLTDEPSKKQKAYYTAQSEPLDLRQLQERFAVLWFCNTKPRKQLLSHVQFLTLVRPLRQLAKIPLPGRPRCYLSTGESHEPTLRLVRFERLQSSRNRDLNDVIADLDAFVSRPQFLLWWYFARGRRFAIDYLIQGQESAQELGRWLARRPPISRVGSSAQPITVAVHEAEPLFRT